MAGNMNKRRGGMINMRDNKTQGVGPNKIEFRFLIPSKAASIIIGKGGDRIQRLRIECNARLSIPDNHGPERVFILESTIDNCIKIWHDYAPELQDHMFPGRSTAGPVSEDDPDMDLRFLVHDSKAGVIIGKAGVNVKNLKTQYDLNVIKVYPNTAPLSTDRVVQLVGKFDSVFDCFREIYDTMETQMIKGPVEKYNSVNYNANLSGAYGGWGGNQSGFDNYRKINQGLLNNQTDRNSFQNGRFNNNRSNDMNRNNGPHRQSGNRFDNFNHFKDKNPSYGGSSHEMGDRNNFSVSFNNRMPNMHSDQNFSGFRKRNNNNMDNEGGGSADFKRVRLGGTHNSNFYNNSPRNDSRNDRNSYNNNDDGDDGDHADCKSGNVESNNTQTERIDVMIPKNLSQAVHGVSGGEVLSNISSDSGAEIIIVSGENGDQNADTVLSLTGTKDQIEGAQYLLQICIKKSVLNL